MEKAILPHGVAVKGKHRYLKRWIFSKSFAAVTIYPYVLHRFKHPHLELVRHEEVHIQQVEDKGYIRFHVSYFVEWLKKGYRANRYEVEARGEEAQHSAARPLNTILIGAIIFAVVAVLVFGCEETLPDNCNPIEHRCR